MEVKQSRWTSKLMWGAIIAQVMILGQLTGLWPAIGIDAGQLQDILFAILQLAVIFGVVNDPTNKTGW